MAPHLTLPAIAVAAHGGNSPKNDCGGRHHLDFNPGSPPDADPALVAGQDVWAHYWSRDPGFAPPAATGLTDALAFTIAT